jgi:uncharacterized protein YacL
MVKKYGEENTNKIFRALMSVLLLIASILSLVFMNEVGICDNAFVEFSRQITLPYHALVYGITGIVLSIICAFTISFDALNFHKTAYAFNILTIISIIGFMVWSAIGIMIIFVSNGECITKAIFPATKLLLAIDFITAFDGIIMLIFFSRNLKELKEKMRQEKNGDKKVNAIELQIS